MNRTTETIIRSVLLAVALLNQILTATGRSPLPIDDEQISALVSAAFTVAAALWSWWKNNSVTDEARMADTYLDALRAAKKQQAGRSEETEGPADTENCGITAEEAQDSHGI